MAIETTPLGFQKPDGNESVRNGDNVIAANAQTAEDLHREALARLANLDNAAGFTGDPLELNDAAFAETLTNGTATQAALEDRLDVQVPPIVAAAIASDPTVAASAATMAQSTAGLVLRTDPGIPQPSPVAIDQFAEVVVDRRGRIASGTLLDGGTYTARHRADESTVGSEKTTDNGSLANYMSVSIDRRRRMAEPNAADMAGQTPAWVLRNHARRTRKALLGVGCYGDSMTFGLGGGGTTYPGTLAVNIPVPVLNFGVSGQSSTEVALRNGGLDVWVTVAGNQIPASGTVNITAVLPAGKWHETSAWTFEGYIAGVLGNLTKDAAGAWTFARMYAGSAVNVDPETRWASAQRVGPLTGRIIWAGRNYPDLAWVPRDIRAMVADADRHNAPYLVLPVFNNTSEPSGSAGYLNVMSINNALAEEHGPNFYDLRGWVIRQGLASAAITPTAADTTAIAEDRIPPSLMSDTIHLNAAGYAAAGRRLAAVTAQKEWY